MDQRIIDLYDRFTHGDLSRREFMDRLASVAGSAAAAVALLPVLTNNYAQAAIVAEDDPRLDISRPRFAAPQGAVDSYLASLKGGDLDRPAVIVIHENRGLNPHIQDVTRRFALEGFLALAPDMLSRQGGTPENEDRAREMIAGVQTKEALEMLVASIGFLEQHPLSNGHVGAVGFCWGGLKVNELAIEAEGLEAGVAYYGRQPPNDEVQRINAPLLLHYAGLDERVNAGIEDYKKALDAAGKTYELHMYEGANHAFNNDTNTARYDKEAADLAWGRTVAFLKRNLG